MWTHLYIFLKLVPLFLRDNHEKFSLKLPDYSICDEIETDLKNYEENWSLFSNFMTSLDDLGKEEWIVIRSRSVQKLEDFLAEWAAKLNARQTSPLTVKLNKEIEKYKSVIPNLKYVRGETFSDKHWLEFYSIVEAPYKPIELITFRDILSLKSKIMVSLWTFNRGGENPWVLLCREGVRSEKRLLRDGTGWECGC